MADNNNSNNNNNTFSATTESLFRGMENFLTTKTVVGDAVKFDDGTIILPLVDVSFGVAAGAFEGEKKNNGAGAMGGKIQPSSVLVIQNGVTKLVNVKNQDGITKVLDMVPDFLNKFSDGLGFTKDGKKNEDSSGDDNNSDFDMDEF